MSLSDYLPTKGNATGVTDGHVYLKRYLNNEAFVWGGKCMRISGDIDTDNGSPSITTRQAVDGGIERDQIREGAPGQTSFLLEMKDSQGNLFKTIVQKCWWVIDKRTHCGGHNRDAWNEWVEITRMCPSKASGRTLTGTDWENPEGEVMAGFPMTALETIDLYRLTGVGGAVNALVCYIADVSTASPARCVDGCDDQEDCVLQAVTSLVAAGSPYLLTNLAGGDLNDWTSIELTEWTTGGGEFILALRNFVLIGSTGETAILYSDDLGVTRVEIDETIVTDWAVNPPTNVDGIDQTYILMCGENGYMYKSVDAARSWKTCNGSGVATTQDLKEVMIARDDPQVAYAIGASNAIIKTENGGDDWYPLTGPSAADALLALWVDHRNRILVWNDDSELWESTDGGESWTQQVAPPGTLAATSTNAAFASCSCDEIMLIATDLTNNLVWRNVYGGASGYWYSKIDSNWAGDGSGFLADSPWAMACCGPNRYIVVGGTATTWAYVLTA